MSNEFEFDMPSDMESSGGKYLQKPGTYHLLCKELDMNPSAKSGEHVDGIKGTFLVLAGIDDSCNDMEVSLTFFHPRESNKDKGKFLRQRQGALFLALGLATPNAVGTRVSIDPDKARNSQCIATLEAGNDKKYLEVKGLEIWPVNHPETAKVRKNERALKLAPNLIDPSEYVKSSPPLANGNGNNSSKKTEMAADFDPASL